MKLWPFLFGSLFAIGSLDSLCCDNGTAILSGQTNYPPLSWTDDNQLVGSTVDIATKLFAEVGIKAIADEGGPWKRVLLRANNGAVDLLLGVRKTAERETFLNYIEPPITPAVQSVFVHKDRDFNYEGWEDLKGKTGNITLGASFGSDFEKYRPNNLSLEYTETIQQGFQKLLLNRVDYMLGPNSTLEIYLQKERLYGTIIAKEKPLIMINEYFAFPKKSACNRYQAHFRQRLKTLIEQGKIDYFLEENFIKWFQKYDPTNW